MDLRDDEFARQLIAELLDANEAAFGVLAAAVGDVVGRGPLHKSLTDRLARAKAAQSHPIRDQLLQTAVQALRPKH